MRQQWTIADMAKRSPSYAGDEVLVRLGVAIRQARMRGGLSQEALAAEAEIDRSYMGGVERGEHNLTVMTLTRIAGALKVQPSQLLAEGGS